MAIIDDADSDWSAGTLLSSDEVWQCQSGWVRISTEGSPEANGGIILRGDRGDAVTIASGKTVKYKVASGVAPHIIVREAF
jgi:hypothetical protein